MKVKSINIIKISRKDSLPDVDLDFEAARRDEVKQYITRRFGEFHTCSIGSYTRLKLKAGIKDFGRIKGLTFQAANTISALIDNQIDYTWKDFIQYAIANPELKDFIQKYPDIAMMIKYALGQCRSASIHASAVIIVPKQNKLGEDVDIFNWLPIRKIDGRLVSEWEGKYTDMGGFLKEDILGLTQLDKFKRITELIKQNRKKKLVLEKIPLTDINTYKLFHRGMNEDVFQFSTSGNKSFSIKVKPDNIEELTAMNALYRPGPMESNAHTDFALIKHGKKKVKYDYGLKEVTEKTYGLYVYQEQIMKSVVVLGGFSLVDADKIRTIIKKFDKVGMLEVAKQFIQGAIKKGCQPDEASKIWDKLVAFSGYGFNKSHSYAYSVMSYWAQYLKCNYSLEFWTTALGFAHEEDVPKIISELRRLKQGITVKPPDVNYSSFNFECDKETNNIYWSFGGVKNIGDASVRSMMEERTKNGPFLSFLDFYKRVTKSKVNSRVIYHLILSGAFDEIENLQKPTERLSLVIFHHLNVGKDLPEEFNDPIVDKSYFWIFKQRELTGFGDVDYKSFLRNLETKESKKMSSLYIEADEFFETKDYAEVCICGKVTYIKERKSKNGEFLVLNIISNNDLILVNIWNSEYEKHAEFFADCKNKDTTTIAITGKVKFDTWRGQQVLHSSDKTMVLAL